MDKYLLFFAFQLTQGVVLGALDPRLWRAAAAGNWQQTLGQLDAEAFGLVLQTLLSGTWVGRLADTCRLLADAVGSSALPMTLMLLQWVVLIGFMLFERRVLARRLARIERGR